MASFQPTKEQLERLVEAFDQVKAENDPLLNDPDAHAFVYTSVYSEVKKRRWCLVVGGKGSGKTALLLGFQRREANRFLDGTTVNLTADDFPLEALFNFFYVSARSTQKRLRDDLPPGTDLPDFIQPARLAQYAWQNSIKYAAVYSAATRLLRNPSQFDLTDTQQKALQKACRAVSRLTGSRWSMRRALEPSELMYALLIYFFENAQEAIDKAVGHPTESLSVLLAAVTLRLGRRLRANLTKPLAEAASLIHGVLQQRSLRVLVTLDKFDDYYDSFGRKYTTSNALRPQQDFLAAILEGLVLATRELAHDPQFDWLAGLVTLPRDKFLELHLRERVAIEAEEGIWLRWTPRELLEFVERRIAHALQLEHVAKAWNHLFPFDVQNGKVKDVREDSFLYLVRHTHWRPREIQLYLRKIFILMDESRLAADDAMFRRAVKIQSEDTIREEFREEFTMEYPGLDAALTKLETQSLRSVMRYDELATLLKRMSLFDDPMPVDQTVLRLFHLGVLGVRAVLQGPRSDQTDSSITQHKQEVAYRYYYNTFQTDPFSQSSTVAFHPMFFEYLNVLHEERYVVNQLTWDMFPAPRRFGETNDLKS